MLGSATFRSMVRILPATGPVAQLSWHTEGYLQLQRQRMHAVPSGRLSPPWHLRGAEDGCMPAGTFDADWDVLSPFLQHLFLDGVTHIAVRRRLAWLSAHSKVALGAPLEAVPAVSQSGV